MNSSILSIPILQSCAEAQRRLRFGYCGQTCPNATAIINAEIRKTIKNAPSLAGPLLRLHFHDCFVRGCDASVLLNSANGKAAEKDGIPNKSLRGYGVIDTVKAKLEKACPGVVSCADILALVARDVVALSKGPYWQVPTGRRDGTVSIARETFQLPRPTDGISQLIQNFAGKGLNVQDLVVLSGAHTIGVSHCSSFCSRIYNSDPRIDPNYAAKLRMKCKPNDLTTLVQMDPGSFTTFDTAYYTQVSRRRGLFNSDAALLQNPQTRAYVLRQATGSASEFFKDFGDSMVKMGNIGVLTGAAGKIRKKCFAVN
ncbi:peroxidase [Musa troglodytarum]|uniref:Peroxidase n=1 Tax=Musa troglodytarum TaxID=320322 RepID=A0A9E7FSP8_9LILI|nr:peroxidase [Musa troglodytarum]